jgi:hypothetical protein
MLLRFIKILPLLFPLSCYLSFAAKAQTQKQISHQSLFWLGSVNTIRLNEHWGIVADFHYRTFDFVAHPYYYIARGLANYYFNENLTAGIGYAHIWSGAFTTDPHPFSNENRITEQAQLNSKTGKFLVSNRWRVEQRWQQKIVNNEKQMIIVLLIVYVMPSLLFILLLKIKCCRLLQIMRR